MITNCGELFFKMLFNKGLPIDIFDKKVAKPILQAKWTKIIKNSNFKII